MPVDEVRAALIVATNEYHDAGLSELRSPANDAQELARVLCNESIGNFDVMTLINEPQYVVMEQLEAFFSDRRRDDLLLLYFSCHGVKDDDGRLHFAATNTRRNRLASTAVPADWVTQQMDRSRSNRVVLMLDCCYSGAFGRGVKGDGGVGVKERFDGRGRVILTASNAIEYSFEGDEVSGTGQPSVFTGALVQGLESGDADRGGDGLIDVDELYDYVYGKVRESTPNQTPGKWALGVEGELYVARSQAPLKSRPLPPELRQAVESPLASVREGAVKTLSQVLMGSHPGLRLSALEVLQHLSEHDDSRSVSEAATSALVLQPDDAPTGGLLSFSPVRSGSTTRTSEPVGDNATGGEPDSPATSSVPVVAPSDPKGVAAPGSPGTAPNPVALPRKPPSRTPSRMTVMLLLVLLLGLGAAPGPAKALAAIPAVVLIVKEVTARRRRSRSPAPSIAPPAASQRPLDPVRAPDLQPPEFQVVALGVAGSGKTVFLASMFHDLSVQKSGRSYFLETDIRERVALSSTFRQVANVSEAWPRGTQVGETREFTFDFAAFHEGAKHQLVRIKYLDYAGELLEAEQAPGSTALATLEDHINGAHALFGMIDGQRILQYLRYEPEGLEYLHHTIQPMIGVMASASCPIQFVITKWDIVRNFGEPEGADDCLRLRIVRQSLMSNTQLAALIAGRFRGERMVRLIPVSAVGPGFAEIDSASRVIKSGRSELAPSNLEIPLSAVLPDFFSKVRSELDAPVRQEIEYRRKDISQLAPRERPGAITTFLGLPAGIALRSTLAGAFGHGQVESLIRTFFSWRSKPVDTKDSPREGENDTNPDVLVDRLRANIVVEFESALRQFEIKCPGSVLNEP